MKMEHEYKYNVGDVVMLNTWDNLCMTREDLQVRSGLFDEEPALFDEDFVVWHKGTSLMVQENGFVYLIVQRNTVTYRDEGKVKELYTVRPCDRLCTFQIMGDAIKELIMTGEVIEDEGISDEVVDKVYNALVPVVSDTENTEVADVVTDEVWEEAYEEYAAREEQLKRRKEHQENIIPIEEMDEWCDVLGYCIEYCSSCAYSGSSCGFDDIYAEALLMNKVWDEEHKTESNRKVDDGNCIECSDSNVRNDDTMDMLDCVRTVSKEEEKVTKDMMRSLKSIGLLRVYIEAQKVAVRLAVEVLAEE